MNYRTIRNGVLGFSCTMLLAGALGSFSPDVRATGCATSWDYTANLMPVSSGSTTCDDPAPSPAGHGRPGLRFLPE